jgi:hypothetical protein
MRSRGMIPRRRNANARWHRWEALRKAPPEAGQEPTGIAPRNLLWALRLGAQNNFAFGAAARSVGAWAIANPDCSLGAPLRPSGQ